MNKSCLVLVAVGGLISSSPLWAMENLENQVVVGPPTKRVKIENEVENNLVHHIKMPSKETLNDLDDEGCVVVGQSKYKLGGQSIPSFTVKEFKSLVRTFVLDSVDTKNFPQQIDFQFSYAGPRLKLEKSSFSLNRKAQFRISLFKE